MILTQKLGMGAVEAGTYVFLSAMAWVPGSLLGGKIADTVGRKKTIVVFQALPALALVPCAFLGSSRLIAWLLIGASFLHGVAEPVNDAMITDLTRPEQRKAAFSLLYLGHNLGVAVGPTIAGFLFANHLVWFFLGDAFTTLLAVLLIGLFVKESAPTREQIQRSFAEDHTAEKAEHGSLLSVLLRRPFLLAFMFINVLFSFVYSQTGFSLPLHLAGVFGEQGARSFGLLMSFNALVVITLTTFLIHLTERITPALTVALSGLFFAAGLGIVGWLRSMPLFLLSTLIWTTGEILSATSASAYVANHSPITHRGRVNAVAPLVMWSGQAFGPPLAAQLIERFSVYAIWPLTFVLSLSGSALLTLVHLLERRNRESNRI